MARQTNKLSVLLDALCCIMYADGEVHPLEREKLYEILMKAHVSWSQGRVNAYIDQFIERAHNESLDRLVQATCEKLAIVRRKDWERKFLGILGSLVKADGVVDDREIRIYEQFKAALCQARVAQSEVDAAAKEPFSPQVSAKPLPANEAATDAAKQRASKSRSTEPVGVNDINQQSIVQSESQGPLDWTVGDVILDLYEVLPVSGDGDAFHRGGMGKVYKVHHKGWNIDLAVKTPHAHSFKTQGQKESFISECEAWINLGMHPQIASCYYVRSLGGIPRIFAEYVDGGSLKHWIETERLYEGGDEKQILARMLDIAIQFAWGLHYAHEQGMIHQDVKPHNLMLTKSREVKVVDFGLARAKAAGGLLSRASDKSQSIMATHAGGYTPAYCSPEQVEGKKLTRRTDIWSWGVSVLEIFAGQVSWESGIAAAKVLEGFLERNGNEEAIPAMPGSTANLLRQCFQVDEQKRPHTLMEITGQLVKIYRQEIGEPYPRQWTDGAADTPDALNNRALSYLDLGKLDEAEKLWDKALTRDAHHLASTYNRGLRRWRTGRMTDADLVQKMEAVRVSHQDRWRDEYLLGNVHIERGDGESAVQILNEATQQAAGDKSVESALVMAQECLIKRGRCVCVFKEDQCDIETVYLSPDGHFVLSAIKGQGVKLWEASTGRCLREYDSHKDKDSHSKYCFSQDGRFFLSSHHEGPVKLWEVNTGQCLQEYDRLDKYHDIPICFSPDNSLFISNTSSRLALREVSTGNCLHKFSTTINFVSFVSCFSPDGSFLLVNNYGGLHQWEVCTGQRTHIFEGHNEIHSVCYLPKGDFIITGGNDCYYEQHDNKDDKLKLWDASSGRCIRTYKGQLSNISSICSSLDGQLILAGGTDGMLELWEIESGRCLRTFQMKSDSRVHFVRFSQDRCYVLASCSSIMELWIFELPLPHKEVGWEFCQISSTEQVIIHENKYQKLYEQAIKQMRTSHFCDALATVRVARTVPGYERNTSILDLHHKIGRYGRAISFRGGWMVRVLTVHKSDLFSFSPQNFIGLTEDGHSARLHELKTGRSIQKYKSYHTASFCFSSDGQLVLIGGHRKFDLFDVATGHCLQTFVGHACKVTSACFSPDNDYALSGGDDNILRLWDVTTGRCIHTFEGHKDAVSSTCFSPDGRFAVSGCSPRDRSSCLEFLGNLDTSLKLWDLASGRCIRTFEGHRNHVNSICSSSDGRFILSGSDDATLKLWDIISGKCIRTFKGHKESTFSVCLSSNGHIALSGSDDATLKLWNVETGRCIYTFREHTDDVLSVAISPDGRFVLSGSYDNTIRLWQLDWDYEIPKPADWDEGAKAYLEIFLTLHCPLGPDGISRVGRPVWKDDDFKRLLQDLQYRGYGWLRPAGVRKKLEEMTANWQGPPPLVGV